VILRADVKLCVCVQVYEGVTDCSEKNAGIRHLNYSASTAYLLIMMFRHLGGVTVKQVYWTLGLLLLQSTHAK
jgi:hypothetical protein